MADFLKKKIVEKLARFTKDLKPSDISLSFLSGKGHLYNLELNAHFITEVLQLPPWIEVTRVVCDRIRGHVPFTSLKTEPVTFYVGTVTIDVSTCAEEGPRTTHSDLLKKIGGGKPSKYGFTEKIIDGMRVEIHSIVVRFHDPTFRAELEMADIVIESTTPQWSIAQSLAQTRYVIADEDSVVVYKMASWSSLKLEGWSTSDPSSQAEHHNSRIRLLSQDSKIKIAYKRNLANSSILATKISVILGDLIWILTQSQLRALSKLIQSLMQAAVKIAREARLERDRQDSDRESVDSMESTVSTTSSEFRGGRLEKTGTGSKTNRKKKSSSVKRSLSASERIVKQRTSDYREGIKVIPQFEVIQNSFHLCSGKIEIQLCGDTEESHTAQGSMLLELCQLVVDVYTDQQAGAGRAHWNEANDLTAKNRNWSRKLIQRASKTQFMDFPSIDLIKLRERVVVIKCSDFSVSALKSGHRPSEINALPVISCDKKTFNIPEDIYNPAFQIGVTSYHYPLEYSNKFSAPRPNVFVYFTPLHVNVDQNSFLWLVQFVYGVVMTINMKLALSVHDEGKSYLESRKADTIETHQLPGVDSKIKILFTKITIPLPGEVVVEDGRPKALQVETGAIKVKNRTLESLLASQDFKHALQKMKRGWVFKTQDTDQFPHFAEDVQSFPSRLRDLIDQALQNERRQSVSSGVQRLGSDEDRLRKLDLSTMEGWYIHTGCVHISFAESYTHQATLYTTQFVDDFPVRLWLFPPRSEMDSSLPSAASTPSNSTKPQNCDPLLSFLVHAPDVIRVELDRAQLLFLMRLKDSITLFKNRLMDFLDTSKFVSPKRTNSPSADSQSSTIDTEEPRTMSGCVIVEHLQANILLPSIFTTANKQNSSQSPEVPEEVDLHVEAMSDSIVTQIEASKSTTDFTGKSLAVDSQQEDIPISQQQSPESPPLSTGSPPLSSSFTMNIPATPTEICSLAKGYGSVSSLPVVSNPNTTITKMYSSANNLTSTPASLGAEKTSLAFLPNTFLSTSPSDFTTTTTLLPPSVVTSTRASSCSLVDDFVIVDSPRHLSVMADRVSSQLPEVNIAAPPPPEQTATKQTRKKRKVKSPPPLSERKVRSSSPLKSEPQYIVCIGVEGIHALPNIMTSGSITARCTVDSIDIRELSKENYPKYKEQSMSKQLPKQEQIGDECKHPVIKVRVEVGDQVTRFFSKPATEADVILILKATGLDICLLTQNMAVLKDFFDDEYEAEVPVPIHVRVDKTKLVILDSPGDSSDSCKSMCIKINQADIHRGISLAKGVNIFMDGGQTIEAQARLSETSEQEPMSLSEFSHDQSEELQDSNAQLLDSFNSFIKRFELHMKLHGNSVQPNHIEGVLAELHTLMSTVNTGEMSKPLPPYSEAVSVMVTSHLQLSSDSNSEVIRLRRENEELRQLQLDRDKLNSQLVHSQSKLEQNLIDLDMVTDECKKAKEELVVYKQVLEKQHERMESLLNENFDLKKRLGFV